MIPIRFKIVLLIIALSMLCALPAAGDLVAHYPMNEGFGDRAFDASGLGNHGAIDGATWEFGSYGTALYFDGVNGDHVNCGNDTSLDIGESGSVLVWFKPEAPLQGGLVNWGLGGAWEEQRFSTLLNNYGNYEEFGVYIADGAAFYRPYRGLLPPAGEWTYLAVTFTRRSMDIYLDGVRIVTEFQKVAPGIAGYDLLIGLTHGWLQDGYFRGLIDEVRIYNTCLSDEEVFELYKAEAAVRGKDVSSFNSVRITPAVYPKAGTIVADLDYRGLAPVPADLVIKAELFRKPEAGGVSGSGVGSSRKSMGGVNQANSSNAKQGTGPPTTPAVSVEMPPVWGEAMAVFDASELPPGQYTVRVRAFSGPLQLGKTSSEEIFWPGREPGWESIKVLNNLCWELLNEAPGSNPDPQYTFFHPRRGWVYFVTDAAKTLTLSVPGAEPSIIHYPLTDEKQEAMRWLDAGTHTIDVAGTGSLDSLIVRSVPALVFAHWPHIKIGLNRVDDHDFLVEHVLPRVNTILSGGIGWFTDEWVNQQGGRWYQVIYKPHADADGTVQGIYDYLTHTQGFTFPEISAIHVDEFYTGVPFVPEWTQACEMIFNDPQYDDMMIIPYCGAEMWADADCAAFLQTIVQGRSWISWMSYFPELETEDRAWLSANNFLMKVRNNLEQIIPDATQNLMVVLSYLTELSGENSEPQADMKVFMDMQFQQLATEPEFFGLAGVEEYVSHHSDEENIRWAAELYRHYVLEGNRSRLGEDPYTLSHLQNGDFLHGTDGWTIDPAETGSIDVKDYRGYGLLQWRRSYGYDTVTPFLWTQRSAIEPNRFSQTLAGLENGRLYSVKLVTGEYQDLINGVSAEKLHAVSIDLIGAEILSGPEYSFSHAGYSYSDVGPFNDNNPYWMNLHCRVFRALGMTVTLTITDWSTPTTPGGPVGQELIYNHIEVQPYYTDPP